MKEPYVADFENIMQEIFEYEIKEKIDFIKKRRSLLIKIFWLMPILIGFLIWLAYSFFGMDIANGEYLGTFIASVFIILLSSFPAMIYIFNSYFKKFLKKQLAKKVAKVFDCYDLEYTKYEPKKNIQNKELNESKLFDRPDFRSDKDAFCGNIDNIKFKFCKTSIQKAILKNFSYNNSELLFSGILILIERAKNLSKGPINIYYPLLSHGNKNDCLIFQIFIVVILSIIIFGYILSMIEQGIMAIISALPLFLLLFLYLYNIPSKFAKENAIEIKRGNSFCRISSNDVNSINCIADSDFLNLMEELAKKYHSSEIRASFYKDKLLLAIPSNATFFNFGDFFAPILNLNVFKPFIKNVIPIFEFIKSYKESGLDNKLE